VLLRSAPAPPPTGSYFATDPSTACASWVGAGAARPRCAGSRRISGEIASRGRWRWGLGRRWRLGRLGRRWRLGGLGRRRRLGRLSRRRRLGRLGDRADRGRCRRLRRNRVAGGDEETDGRTGVSRKERVARFRRSVDGDAVPTRRVTALPLVGEADRCPTRPFPGVCLQSLPDFGSPDHRRGRGVVRGALAPERDVDAADQRRKQGHAEHNLARLVEATGAISQTSDLG